MAGDLPELLRLVIRSELYEGRPTAPRVAHQAGMSLRLMQRRLADAEIRFSDLVREALMERATELLAQPGWRVTDIGLEIGYSESANFTRAFRRWTGLSPRAYRRGMPLRPDRAGEPSPGPAG